MLSILKEIQISSLISKPRIPSKQVLMPLKAKAKDKGKAPQTQPTKLESSSLLQNSCLQPS